MAGKVLYTAEAHVVGGRENGHGKTADGVLEVDLRPPGGDEVGTNPEQLYAIGHAACFEGALAVVGRREKVELGAVAIDSEIDLKTSDDRGFEIGIRLRVSLPEVEDAAKAKELVAAAHQVCPYSKATRGNVEVELFANGEPVDA